MIADCRIRATHAGFTTNQDQTHAPEGSYNDAMHKIKSKPLMKRALLSLLLLPAISTMAAAADSGSVVDTNFSQKTLPDGQMRITAERTQYDKDRAFTAEGKVRVSIGGQDSMLEADRVVYDQQTEIISARGNVRIWRTGQLTTGSAFAFQSSSDEYLVTKPDTEVVDPMGERVASQSSTAIRLKPTSTLWLVLDGESSRGVQDGDFGSNELHFVPGAGLTNPLAIPSTSD